MSGGGYRGGSTVFRAGKSGKMNPRRKQDRIEDIIDARRGEGKSSRRKLVKGKPVEQPPGLHVLSKPERIEILRKIKKSRAASEERQRANGELAVKKKRDAYAKFVKDMKKRTQ